MRLIRVLVPALVASAALVNSAAASADTVIGQTAAPTAACTPGTLYQAATAAPPSYTSPDFGVIRSFTVQTDANVAPIKLKVLHALGGGSYRVVGESAAVTPAPNSTQTFLTRVPMGPGDYLGISVLSGTADCRFGTADYGDAVRESSTVDPAVGSTITVPTSHPNSRLDVSALVEPDRDRDGYGDSSQDECPSDPTTQAFCSADVSVKVVSVFKSPRVGRTITWSITAHNASPYNNAPATVELHLPRWVRIDAVTSSTGASCRHFFTHFFERNVAVCDQPLPADSFVGITVKSTPLAPGWIHAEGFIDADPFSDPNPANNRVTARRFIEGVAPACVLPLDGNSAGNQLTGTPAGDRIRGFGGADRIYGYGGPDCLDGGPGNDRLHGGRGADVLRGGRGHDVIYGGAGRDAIYGGAGDDVIYANDGERDVIHCGPGLDTVHADPRDKVGGDCEQVVRSRRL